MANKSPHEFISTGVNLTGVCSENASENNGNRLSLRFSQLLARPKIQTCGAAKVENVFTFAFCVLRNYLVYSYLLRANRKGILYNLLVNGSD